MSWEQDKKIIEAEAAKEKLIRAKGVVVDLNSYDVTRAFRKAAMIYSDRCYEEECTPLYRPKILLTSVSMVPEAYGNDEEWLFTFEIQEV